MEQPDQTTGFSQFVAEMKRRHVVRFAFGYAAATFVVLQLAEIVFPAFGIGETGLRTLVVVTALGFPPALVLAWVYDITNEGIKRTGEEGGTSPALSKLALAALLIATLGVTGGLGGYLASQGVFEPTADEVTAGRSRFVAQPVAYDPSVPIRSLAVLPLEDFSPTGDQAYFASGMHEELIAKLSMLDGIRVVSRTTVMQYQGSRPTMPEIGRELGVDVIVEGSVSRSENRVRVTLQIIHAPSDSHIETLQWDRDDIRDVLAFQTEVAHAVVHEIEGVHEEAMFERFATTNIEPDAQEPYLRGKHEYDRGTVDGYRMALDYFQEALDQDPDFADAMAGLAGARFMIGLEDPEDADVEIRLAHDEAMAALELDPTSLEAMEVFSLIERSMPRIMSAPAPPDVPVVEPETHVFALSGTFDSFVIDVGAFDTMWVSATTSLGDRIEEVVRRRGMGLGRGGSAWNREVAEARQLMSSGNYTGATRVLEGIVQKTPEMATAWEWLARSHVASGDVTAAKVVIEQWQATGDPNAPDRSSVLRLEDAIEFEGTRGYWSWALEGLTAAEAEGRQPVSRMDFASAHAALGNTDEAFRFLYEALMLSERGILTLRTDPVWDEYRSNPAFQRIVREAQSMRFSPARRPSRRGGPSDGR